MSTERRTKRRYAHELYPHRNEGDLRPIETEVRYLYARAIGFDVTGTGWFAHTPDTKNRIHQMIDAQRIALMADAMARGFTGQYAWEWVERRVGSDPEWFYEEASKCVSNWRDIKPYPCGPTPDHHEHQGELDAHGFYPITRAPGPEDQCPDCTEPVDVKP